MPLIPLPEPKEKDIYSFDFDKNLNRIREQEAKSSVVYNTINDLTAAQAIQFGALTAGSQNSIFIVDPTKGMWLGNAQFSSAPFRVNMAGDLVANSITISGVLMEKVAIFTTNVTVADTTTETDLFNFTLNGGSLSTSNALFGKIILSNLDTDGQSLTFRVYYGATSILASATAAANLDAMKGTIDFMILAAGATNSQDISIHCFASEQIFGTGNTIDFYTAGGAGTAAIDSTANATVKVTVQWGAAGVGNTLTAVTGIAYLVR